MFEQVKKQSLSNAVFEQLRDRIVRGEMEVGDPLPAERILAENWASTEAQYVKA